MPYTWFSVVINNPTDSDHQQVAKALKQGWLVEGQEEVGKNGTPHLQLAVATTGEDWAAVKGHFPRANIQEAKDSVALRKYVVKTETRRLDLTQAAPKTKCPPKLDNLSLYEGLFCTASQMGISSSELLSDNSLKLYDSLVSQWMGDASTPQFAMELATRANRPDVRAIYRRYRSALIEMWQPTEESVDLPTNADDYEGSTQARGLLEGEHDDEEDGTCEGQEDSEGSEDSDSGQSADSGDSESDQGSE